MALLYFGSNQIQSQAGPSYEPLKVSITRSSDFPSTMNIPSNVVGLDNNCFKGCANITSFVLPPTVNSIGQSCFENCSYVTSVNIPNAVTSLPSRCFYGCSRLSSLTLSSSLTSIGDSCFYGCSALTALNMPSTLTSLGSSCFYNCSSLNNITIPQSVTSLGSQCFSGCSSLTSISISSSINSLPSSCFSSCTSLASITIPSTVTSLGSSCFSGCTSLTGVTLPNSVTSLGSSCFGSCTALKSVNLSTGLSSLIDNCFNGCTSLESVTFPSSIGSLSNYCFKGCTSLLSLTIPSTLTSIGQYCFQNDTALAYMSILSSPSSINSYAFSGCTDLDTVYFAGNPPTSLASNAFSGLSFTAYYNSSNSAWTSAIRTSTYGGAASVTWLDQSQRPIIQAKTKYTKEGNISSTDGIVDGSTRENHGTASGGVELTSVAFFGKCLGFDGTNDKVTFNKNTFCNAFSGISALSVAFKMRPSVVSGTDIVLVEGFYSSSASFFAIRLTGGKIKYSVRRTTSNTWVTYTSSASITAGADYAIVVVFNYSSAKASLYINGTLDSENNTGQGSGTLQITPIYCYVGAHNESGRYFKGYIKDVSIYGRTLSSDEISALGKMAGVGDTAPVLPENSAGSNPYQGTPALIMEHGSIKKIVVGDQTDKKLKLFDVDGTRSSGTYTDYDYTVDNIDFTVGLAEDNDGYIYTTGANTGYIVKYQIKSRTLDGQLNFYIERVAMLKLGNLVAANQVQYCSVRDALIVTGWESGGGTSRCYQIPRNLSTCTSIAVWGLPSLAGCFDPTGTKLFVCLYGGSYQFAMFQFSSVSDVTEKSSYVMTIRPQGYSSAISVASDSRYIMFDSSGYMYLQMLNGNVYKYDVDGNYIAMVGNIGSSGNGNTTIRSDCVITYYSVKNVLVFSQTNGNIGCLYL